MYNPDKKVQDLYTDNHKKLLTENKEDLTKWRCTVLINQKI